MKTRYCKSKSIIMFAFFASISFGYYFGLSDDRSTPMVNPDFGSVTSTEYHGDLVGSWSYGANVLLPSRFAGVGVSYMRNDSGWLYMMGGDTNGLGGVTNRNECYNISSNSWQVMSPMISPLFYMGGARLKDSLYTVGGLVSGAFTSSVNNLRRYDINSNGWAERTPLPQVLGWSEAVGYQDSLLFALGGMINGTSAAGPQVYLYNSINNSWRPATPLPAARVGGAAAISGDTIVYVGGAIGYFGVPVDEVYRGVISQSDRSVISWSEGTPKPGTTRWRFDAHPWGCKGIIVDMGAATGFGSSTEVYVYSPGSNTWTQQPNALAPVSSSQSGSFGFSSSIYKLVCASGLVLLPPFSIPQTQIFIDTLCPVIYPQTAICKNILNKSILDFVLTYDTIKVGLGNECVVRDVNVRIDSVIHTWVSNLTFYIRRGSIGLKIIDRVDGSGDDFIGTVLNDSAAVTINNGTPPFTGQFRPSPPALLSAFNSQPADGDWILTITDTVNGDTGLLKAWCLIISYQCPVGGIQTVEIPNYYFLSQNYPNPFNPVTTISYALPKGGNVRFVVYDVLGREVAVIVDEYKHQGIYEVAFDGSSLSSGIYFYRIETEDFTQTKKMLLVK